MLTLKDTDMKSIEKCIYKKITSITFLVVGMLFISSQLVASTNETFAQGAYIINMSDASPNYDNGLKPYGLIYQLLVNHNVPVKWAINQTKGKDGIDFSIGTDNYRGGSFIIPAEYVNSSVVTLLGNWDDDVDVDGPINTSFIAPIYTTINSWPEVLVNNKKEDIVRAYFQSADIPTSFYDIGPPGDLDECHDLFLMPHADPQSEWSANDKAKLLDFMDNKNGFFWGACETVGNIEGELTADFHFLSENGLLTTSQHGDGTPNNYLINSAYDGDPIMQFMGNFGNVTANGSEEIYMPAKGNNWRSNSKLAIYQPNHPDADNNKAAVLIYGPTKGDFSKGMVLYEAGHKINSQGSTAQKVAAQRAFFNFILLAGVEQEMNVTSVIPTSIASGATVNLSVTPISGQSPFIYNWTSSCSGGTFTSTNTATTTYSAPTVSSATTCVITVLVTDDCGRFIIESKTVTVAPANGPVAMDDNANTKINTPVDIDILTNDTPGSAALDPTSVTFVGGTIPDPTTEGVFTVNSTTGLVTFTPANNYTGTVTVDYNVCDLNNLCDVATITVVVSPFIGPTAVDDTRSTEKNTPIDIIALSNDQIGDSPLDPTSVSFISGTEPDAANEGVFTKNGTTGLVTFTPVTDFLGTVTINYEVCDDNSLCSIATITVSVIDGTTNYYPAGGLGTLAYEDLWPGKGDYDFNDMVIDYQFEIVSNINNFVENVTASFTIKATGASYQNGFGFQFSSAVTASDLTVTGSSLKENIITLDGNGTESGQSLATIIVFDNVYQEMAHPGGAIGINTEESAPYVTPVTIVVNIVFASDTYTYNDLDISNFNPFIFVNLDRTVEVHLPDYPPTDLANTSLFGTENDDSNPSTGKYYKTENNLPWAIHIYESFDYPIEKQQVVWAYLKFAEWAENNGTTFQDWYKDLQGYRNSSLIYTVPSN